MPPRNRQHAKFKREVKDVKPEHMEVSSDMKLIADWKPHKPWAPSPYTAFKVLLSARLCAAVWSNISDCDEVFNYWEPMHYLLYGEGFQTWEYSPLYAIRSYAYLWVHALPSYLYSTMLQSNKVLVFYFLRCLLAFFSALCEVYFYKSICYHFGPCIGRLVLLFFTVGSGLFISSTAFLPSTFSMYLSSVAFAAWFIQKYEIAILSTAVSAMIGWPFSVLLGLPIAFDIIVLKRKFVLFVKSALASLSLIIIPLVFIDSKHFGKLVLAPLNIVLYNVFSSHGPNLYGTEPFSYYFLNGILNFNLVFICSIAALPIMAFLHHFEKYNKKSTKSPPLILCLAPMYLWMFVFFTLSHKEERFLFPIYPMICLAGACTVDTIQASYHRVFSKLNLRDFLDHTKWISIAFCIVYVILSLSRTTLLYKGYRAPIETYMELGRISTDQDIHPLPPEYPVNVCVGKEWYRFPSSFFLPLNWNLRFLQSEFRGQLPKQFSNLPNATMIIPEDMNDKNLEEKSRYVDLKACDYIVDSNYPDTSLLEPNYSQNSDWTVISTIPFLNAQRSHRLLRAFYVPYFTDYYCEYVDYNLLQRVTIKNRIRKKKRYAPR
ncbi:alpha-1,2-mannosyltransferase ALG9-like [Uloborus diversus]|uniref:alpha-1,2-mannosyltransferase ALG9-like n=1 Tax=Uloborus diversus TaxID=327109 RepID=UPI002409A1F1|nr:alpha-1,2-mannosyltransferase ALG9-like [Uloborus diversus]